MYCYQLQSDIMETTTESHKRRLAALLAAFDEIETSSSKPDKLFSQPYMLSLSLSIIDCWIVAAALSPAPTTPHQLLEVYHSKQTIQDFLNILEALSVSIKTTN